MWILPSKKCRSFATQDAAAKAAVRFFYDLVPEQFDDFDGLHWCVVAANTEATRWTVLVFITHPKCMRYARRIAEHRWKVTA